MGSFCFSGETSIVQMTALPHQGAFAYCPFFTDLFTALRSFPVTLQLFFRQKCGEWLKNSVLRQKMAFHSKKLTFSGKYVILFLYHESG